jgi:hypothetical protein
MRKAALTAHVTVSLGWFGAVAAFLALAITGLFTHDSHLARGSYVAMERITWFVIVPFALASLVTGVIESLSTPWGLFRHYWVLAKLLLTTIATLLLFVHTRPITSLASAARGVGFGADAAQLQLKLVVDAALALAVLSITTVLAIYKPRGLTPHGQRLRHEQRLTSSTHENPSRSEREDCRRIPDGESDYTGVPHARASHGSGR